MTKQEFAYFSAVLFAVITLSCWAIGANFSAVLSAFGFGASFQWIVEDYHLNKKRL